jgi:two-component system CheB/CheR fusion protein
LPGIDRVFALMRTRFGVDFSNYKSSTVSRRIRRRMTLRHVATFDDYLNTLHSDVDELDQLYRDLLIGVTRFFRDGEMFARLHDHILPELLQRIESGRAVRAWVAGCATGEEAYSLAIVLHELMTAAGRSPNVKIFATDVHKASIDFAAKGFYPDAAIDEIDHGRRDRYFTKVPGGWQIVPEVRQMIVFAPHNLVQDAPFTQLDLVSCRNLLIYFDNPTQKKAISFFHFALRTGGVLVLGPSESLGELDDEFTSIDKRWRVYSKRRDVRLATDLRLDFTPQTSRLPRAASGLGRIRSTSFDNQLLATYDRLLELKMPPSFLVDQQGELLHTFGGAERWLAPQAGRTTRSLPQLLPADLRTPVAAAIQHALRESTVVRYTGIELHDAQGPAQQIDIVVRPLGHPEPLSAHLLIELESPAGQTIEPGAADEPVDSNSINARELTAQHVRSLESELQSAQENLQATVEELESANEELQSSNEELVASNEELQSTNEELHSVNEELYTVNAEHQRKIEELTQVTEDLDHLIASIQVGVVFLDNQLRIRRFTDDMADVFHLIPSDIGRRIDGFASRIDYVDLVGELESVVRTGQIIEHDVAGPDERHYLMRVLPYHAETHNRGVLLTMVDVTTLKQAEQQLRDSESKFRLLLESTAEGIIGLDRQGRCNFVNQSALSLLGCSDASELVGADICPFIHKLPAGSERAAITGSDTDCAICDALISGQAVHERNVTFRRSDGTRFDVDYWSHPIAQHGELSGAVVTFFDVTQRRSIEETLELRSRILELSNDAVIIWNLDGGIIFWNHGAESLYGYTSEQALGKTSNELLQTTHPVDFAIIRQALVEQGDWSGELAQIASDGRCVHVSSRHQLVRTSTGDPLVLEINRDITEMLESQAALHRAREEAEVANRAKSSFLANMSHELRTPLTAILGFADMLLTGLEDPENRQRAGVIRDNGNYLLALLNDILDLSKVEAGKMSIDPQPTEVVRMLAEVASLMRNRAEAKELDLHFRLMSPVPRVLSVDRKMLRQVVVNLLGNAIKFTEVGDVTFAVGTQDHPQHNSRCLAIEVTDTGVGIDASDLNRIFRPFEQVDERRIGIPTGGTGLGLSISRLLARTLGGEIEVTSQPGQGSSFRLLLPLVDASDDSIAPEEFDRYLAEHNDSQSDNDLPRLDGRRVVVADDRRDIRHVAEFFLRRAGAHVLPANNGAEAVELVTQQLRDSLRVDLVLMDMQMPVMDGYDATRQLREFGFAGPIIALTAAAMVGERQRCIEAGCCDHVSKPIDPMVLLTTCRRHLGQPSLID